MIGIGNGQWVRARNDASAKAFLEERQMDATRLRERRGRSADFWRRVTSRFTRWGQARTRR